MSEDEVAERTRRLETELWEAYAAEEAERYRLRLERRFLWACGTLLALIGGFNAWLVYLIWFSR